MSLNYNGICRIPYENASRTGLRNFCTSRPIRFQPRKYKFLGFNPHPMLFFFFFLVLEFLFRRRVTCQLSNEKKKSGTWIEICQGNYDKMSAMNIHFLRDCHNLIADLSSALITVCDLEMKQ